MAADHGTRAALDVGVVWALDAPMGRNPFARSENRQIQPRAPKASRAERRTTEMPSSETETADCAEIGLRQCHDYKAR